MGRLRGWLRRLERQSEGEIIRIPQKDGTVAKFPQDAYAEAFLNAIETMGGGEVAPPLHPLLEAARNSSDPRWRDSYFSDIDYDGAPTPIEDLSE
jgi:hypothetical protein